MRAAFFINSIERWPSWVTFALHHLTKLTKSIFLLLTRSDFVSSHPWTIKVHQFHLRQCEDHACVCEELLSRGKYTPTTTSRFLWDGGTYRHALPAIPCLLFYLCLLFQLGSNQLPLTLRHWLSMGPFRNYFSSTDWNIISCCCTSTLGVLRSAPCNPLTIALSYLLVTRRPLV